MSRIVYGKALEREIREAVEGCAFSVTDGNLARLYPELTKNSFVIAAGEKSKTPETLFSILSAMSDARLTRADRVAAIGGGVVGDITGLAAALYMRGIKWTSIPTSLLAMVDSGIGGKTAVDFRGVKNLVGAFHMPEDILISTHFLKTLPEREWLCGTGELVKTCILSEDAYARFKANADKVFSRDPEALFETVKLCVEIKNSVVEKDPTEKGLRKILNVGHTVGHALESLDGYRLSHGEYVIKGMLAEFAMFRDKMDAAFYSEIMPVLARFSSPPELAATDVAEKAMSDKKNSGGTVSVMIPRTAGEVNEIKVSKAEFAERYEAAREELKAWASLR